MENNERLQFPDLVRELTRRLITLEQNYAAFQRFTVEHVNRQTKEHNALVDEHNALVRALRPDHAHPGVVLAQQAVEGNRAARRAARRKGS